MRIVLDPKQLEMIQQMLDRVVKVAQGIQLEMRRANNLKEKEIKDKES